MTIATSNRSPLTAQTGDPFPVLICGVPQIGVWRPVALYTMRRRGRVDDRPAVSGTSAVRASTDLTGTDGLVGLCRGLHRYLQGAARQAFLYRDRRQGDEKIRGFLAAREAAINVGIPDEVAVYRLADQMIRERDQQRLG